MVGPAERKDAQPRRIGRAEASGRATARSRANTARPAPAMRAIPTHTTGPGTSPDTAQPQKTASGKLPGGELHVQFGILQADGDDHINTGNSFDVQFDHPGLLTQ